MLEKDTISFLRNLKKNNRKEWFDENRKTYEKARADFSEFINNLIAETAKFDPEIAHLTAKDCLFRINRDIRFSKDKSPYKTNFGASINKGGRKSTLAGYYFHLEPGGNSFIGGGVYMPMPPELKMIRQEIDYNYAEFTKLLTNKTFRKIYDDLDKSAEFSLSTTPKGYEKDNPAIEYLRLKSFIADKTVTDEDLTSKSLLKNTVDAFKALHPLLLFLNRSVD